MNDSPQSVSATFLACVWLLLCPAASLPAAEASPPTLFEKLSAEKTGVNFVHALDEDHLLSYLYNSGFACGGVALGDVDGDGKCDIFLASGPGDNALFLNKGGFRFEKSAASEALADQGIWGVGPTLADVNGDGALDLFVCNYESANRLFLNDGRGNFKECGVAAGLAHAGPSHTAYFADFDGDGDLDLFLLTNRLLSPFGRPREVASELGPDRQPRVKEKYAKYFRVVQPPASTSTTGESESGEGSKPFLLELGHPDRLYRNDGAGPDGTPKFTDITRESGFGTDPGHGLSALIWDVNHDGRPDIFVANDFTDEDRLWLNLGPSPSGAIQFREALDEYLPYTAWSSMGSDLGDMNGDGRLDFVVADMAGTTHFKAKTTMGEMSGWRRWVLENGWPRQAMRNMLYIDSGAGRFLETAYASGVAKTDWTWAVKCGDFDLDGRPDLFFTNGIARNFGNSDIILTPAMFVGRTEWEAFRNTPVLREKHLAFRNEGGLNFSDTSRAWGLDQEAMSYGAAMGDLDGDGALDLVVCHLAENVSLLRNRAAEKGAHWLKVRLEGQKNRLGFGAHVTAKLADGQTLVRLMNPQTGFLSGNEPILHFGLGAHAEVASLEVRWPDGKVQTLGAQKADRVLIVREAEAPSGKPTPPAPTAPLFAEVAEKIGLKFKHHDKPFNDFKREFLLPAQLSQFGPGVSVADVNGDGLDDVFVGGAAGQSGQLFVHQSDHTFRALENPPWAAHAESEQMGALFFDADRDGKLDLYIVTGSNEWEAGDAHYADHLYLNKTDGSTVAFAPAAAGALPEARESGSCVVGADFDRDGDVDLFVGARGVPGKYPLTPNSALLRNDGAKRGQVKFTEVADKVAPGLREAGLVTAALWSDVDGDGWLDLLVTCEWGPVRLFMNAKGKLDEATDSAGLADRLGWWNSIAGADFDGDGDLDYVALNVGLNTKYGHPTPEKAATLYRGDLDRNGVFDLIEAKTTSAGELPVRGRSCSSIAMPFIKEKFKTYKAFAQADLTGIYSEDRLAESQKVAATEFESGVLINDSTAGQPRFTWRPLPSQAQLSPGYGAVCADFSGAGHPALAISQNLYTREPETGLWRGGLGSLLQPDAKGSALSFTAEEHARSGFVVAGDGKGLALADLDANGWPDLIAAQNNGALLAFANRHPATAMPLAIRLAGLPGNPVAIGARVSLLAGDKALATVELHGGSGYSSQSAAAAFFARPAGNTPLRVSIRWPLGKTTTHAIDGALPTIIIHAPEA